MLDDQIFCPTCGADTEHSMIKSGQENLVRCVECETVHSVQVERERLVNLKVIVSNDELSMPYYIKIPAREMLRVGDELLVDDPAKDVKTVWARATDDVPLKISIYRNGKTHSLKILVSGDEVFEVGEARKVEGFKFVIVKMKLRGEGFADMAEAKDIQRVWGREL
jgi:uncharacterized Zn finger protein